MLLTVGHVRLLRLASYTKFILQAVTHAITELSELCTSSIMYAKLKHQ